MARRPADRGPAGDARSERLVKWGGGAPSSRCRRRSCWSSSSSGLAAVFWQWRNTAIANSRLTRSLYIADMQLGAQAFANQQFLRIEELVRAHTPGRAGGTDDLRGFEWHYLKAVSTRADDDPRPQGRGRGRDLQPGQHPVRDRRDGQGRPAVGHGDRSLAADLAGHTDDVKTVGFHPDGTRIASGSYDRTARIWEVDTGRLAGSRTVPRRP